MTPSGSHYIAWQFLLNAHIQSLQSDPELLDAPVRSRVTSTDGECYESTSHCTTFRTASGSPVHLGPMSPLVQSAASATRSSSSRLSCSDSHIDNKSHLTEDDALRSIAQDAMKRVNSVSSNTFVKGTWKQRRSQADDLVLEHRSQSEYRIVAQSIVPCAIHEISSVLSASSSDHFNASMIELLGSEFSYGLTVRSVSTTPPTATKPETMTRLSVKALSFGRDSLASSTMGSEGNYLDYTERDPILRTERRALQKITQRHGPEGKVQVVAGNSLCGYALHEETETKHTVILLYGTYSSNSCEPEDRALRHAAIHRFRKLAQLSTKWVQIALRRRLGTQTILDPHIDASCSLVELSCVGCGQEFHLIFRKRHFCHLCGLHACANCSSVEDVEQQLGQVKRLRICQGCVAEVSQNAFHSANTAEKYHQHKNHGLERRSCSFSSSSLDSRPKYWLLILTINCQSWVWQPTESRRDAALKACGATLASDRSHRCLPDVRRGVRISVPQPGTSLTPDQPVTQDYATSVRSRVLAFPERLALVLFARAASAAGAKLIDQVHVVACLSKHRPKALAFDGLLEPAVLPLAPIPHRDNRACSAFEQLLEPL